MNQIQEKPLKFSLRVITDSCVKITVFEICTEKETRESVVGNFINICTVAVHCWHIKNVAAGWKNWQKKLMSRLVDFGY